MNIDANPDNRDWTKRTWDLLGIKNLKDLRRYIAGAGMTVKQFKKLPVYRFNVDKMPWLKGL